MPDKRKHRGQHPQDKKLFDDRFLNALKNGVADMSWLLSRGYGEKASLTIVGDRYRLTARQRLAVQRAVCDDASLAYRTKQKLSPLQMRDKTVFIDGYNLLITIESALSGGFIFVGRDGAYRDLASVHGTYRRVEETQKAIEQIAKCMQELNIAKAYWYFDTPISNSGRLKTYFYELATQHNWNWEIHLDYNPDRVLCNCGGIVVTSDGMILNNVTQWFNLAKYVIDTSIPDTQFIHLG